MSSHDLLARRAILARAVAFELEEATMDGGPLLSGREVAVLYALAAYGPAPVPLPLLAAATGLRTTRWARQLLEALASFEWVESTGDDEWQLGPDLLRRAHRLGADS